MTSLTSASNNLGESEFIHYNTYDTTPIPACPIVSKYKGLRFSKGWLQADTAEQCHKNSFKLYDQYRKWEDDQIKTMDKKNGLRIKTVQSVPPNVNIFNGKPSSEYGISKNISPGQSVEFFGFFMPTTTGFYKFSFSTGNGGRIWAGDVACHEYMDTNQTREHIQMYANKYYAVRFQNWNSTRDNQSVQIQVSLKDGNVPEPKFVSLIKSNGWHFNRSLLYYGLVKSESAGKYYCYFNARSNYHEIRNTKGVDSVERSFTWQSDANPPPKNGQKVASEWHDELKLAVNSDPIHNVNITNGTYRVPPGRGRWVNYPEPETDPNKLKEWYTVTVYNYQTRSRRYWWWGWRTQTWRERVAPFFEWRSRPKNPVPKKPKWVYEEPGPLNVTNKAKGMGDLNIGRGRYNAAWGDPAPGLAKQTIIDYTSKIKPELLKNKKIRVNDKCSVTVNYNNMPDATADLFTGGGTCTDKRLVINNDGTVTINGSSWINIMSSVPEGDRSNLVPSQLWLSQRHPNSLNVGADLSTIISSDGRFKLEFNRGTLRCYYNIKLILTDSSNTKYTNMVSGSDSPQALFLYRPNYSELGGRKYTTIPNPNGSGNKMLVEIKANHSELKTSNFNTEKGYPILFNQYKKVTGDCMKMCAKSEKCGNYITYGNNKCGLDQTSNVNPMYSTTPPLDGELAREKIPTIYIKNQTMSGYQSFKLESAGNYSDYEISKDTYKISSSAPVEPDEASKVINERYNLYDSIIKKIEPKKEGFSDIPPRFSNRLPNAPETSVEEGRIEDLQTIMFQQNVLYSVSSIAALSFLAGTIVLARN
jgi:hypothetical protein